MAISHHAPIAVQSRKESSASAGCAVGLAGLGYWGKNIFRNLFELGVLHAACDPMPEVLKDFKAKYDGQASAHDGRPVRYTFSFEDLLEDPAIRAVAIATPAATHYDLVKQALLADKDVYVEKPLALTVREGSELVDLARDRQRVLMVGHILQFHPAVLKLKEIVSEGTLGKIQYVYSNRLNIGKLRTEENILWSFAPHDISVILMLLDETPVSVSAFGGDYLNSEIYDTTMTVLEFRNGVKGHIFVSWLHPYKEQKLIVVGSEGMAVFDDMSAEKLFLYPHKIEWKEGRIPVAHKADFTVVPFEPAEPLKEELRHFLECVGLRKRPRTDGEEGLRVLDILERAERSIKGKGSKEPAEFAVHDRVQSGEWIHRSASIHKSAYIDEGVKIGENARIWHFSHVLKGSVIGERSVIGQNVSIGPEVSVGSGCKIQNNVSLYKGVTLEDDVFCGPSCVFTNVYNPRAFIERKKEFRETLVRKGATIGANATIVCGATIGRYAVVGAGAVVKADVSDYAIVAGVPAQRIGWACKCGVTLRFEHREAVCLSCGNEYAEGEDGALLVRREG